MRMRWVELIPEECILEEYEVGEHVVVAKLLCGERRCEFRAMLSTEGNIIAHEIVCLE